MFYRFIHPQAITRALLNRFSMENGWIGCVTTYPHLSEVLWDTLLTDQCTERALKENWPSRDSYHYLKEAIVVLYAILGPDLATQVLYEGQTPVLVALMGVRHHILEINEEVEALDLQSVLLTTSLKAIVAQHPFQDREMTILEMLQVMEVDVDLADCVLENAVKIELVSHKPDLKVKLNHV